MKKLIYCAAALATALFAGSCQQEMLDTTATETTVTYTVALPDAQTKAIGDADTVDQLIYEVWKTEAADERNLTDETKAIRLYQENTALVERNGKICAVITLNLVQDQEYTILFWAQKKGTGVYNTDYLTNVHYEKSPKTGLLSNQEDYAAFYATDFVSDSDPKSKTVVLKRPFAQLNLATKNTADEYGVVVESSKVIVTKVGSHFNVATNIAETPGNRGVNSVTEPLEFVFNTANDPSGEDEYITVNGQKYEYVAMNYMFATGETVTVQYEINTILTGTNGQAATAKVTNEVLNVPLKENYRTNIVGNLLTSTTDYEVVIDASWDDQGDGTLVEVWDSKYAQAPYYNEAKGQYEISLASELVWLAHAVNGTLENPAAETKTVGYYDSETFEGKTFVLKEDIDLKNVLWTPIGANGKIFNGTFDGQGHTIKNLKVVATNKEHAGLFGETKGCYISNVVLNNVELTGNYKAGAIIADGLCARIDNCHVIGLTINVTPHDNDDANQVGGIVGYLSAQHNAHAKNCSVRNATISAYRDVAGIAGMAQYGAIVSDCHVENVVITSDQTPAYDETKDGNAGIFAGRISGTPTFSNNTYECVTVIRKVDSTEELEYAVADAQSGDTIYIGGEVTMPYFTNKVLNFEGIANNAVVKQSPAAHNDKFYEGAELNFSNLTLVGTSYQNNTQGYQEAVKETYTNCHFVDYIMFAGDETIVNNCTFASTVGQYFWTGTADDITFNNCKFNVLERAIKVCTVGNNGARTATFNNCEFKAAQENKAAIEIDGSKGSSYVVNINNCTATGFAEGKATQETLFNVEGTENVDVYVNGDKWISSGIWQRANETKYYTNVIGIQTALDATPENESITINLGADIIGNVVDYQKAGRNITINGTCADESRSSANYKWDGTIMIHNGSNYNNGTITIKNVAFETSTPSLNFIMPNDFGVDENNVTRRYSNNVTVENCTFTATGEAVNTVVGVQAKATRGVTVTGCTATDMHSLIQAQSCDTGDVMVVGCTVNGKNGVAFKQVKSATVEGTTITALEYGIRFDGNIDNYGIVVKNNNVTANQPLIVRKMTGKNNTITLEGTNTLTTEAEYQIVITNGSDDEAYVKPTGTYTLTGADAYTIFPAPFPVAS